MRCWDCTRAGKNSCTSPKPVASISTSTSDAVGQPPPGKRASSVGLPVDQTGRGGRAAPSFNFQTRASARMSASDAASRSIHVFTTPQDANDDPLDDHRLGLQIDSYGLEIGIFRQQPDDRAFLAVALDRDLVFQARNDD